MTRILVLGATGRQGGAVARRSVERGHEVSAIVRDARSPAARALVERGVRPVTGDLRDADVGGGASFIQWLGSAYTLSLAAGLLVGGRLGDMLGRRAIYCVGMTGFVLASLACGSAGSPDLLVVARVVQGASAALVLPQSLGVVRAVFPAELLGTAFAIYGPVTGAAALLGPVLAGVLISADLFASAWRAVFLVNVPFGLALLLVITKQATELPNLLLSGAAQKFLVRPFLLLFCLLCARPLPPFPQRGPSRFCLRERKLRWLRLHILQSPTAYLRNYCPLLRRGVRREEYEQMGRELSDVLAEELDWCGLWRRLMIVR